MCCHGNESQYTNWCAVRGMKLVQGMIFKVDVNFERVSKITNERALAQFSGRNFIKTSVNFVQLTFHFFSIGGHLEIFITNKGIKE